MAEKAILAYFHSPEQAHGAAAKLKALRAEDVQVDRFTNDIGHGLESAMADSMLSDKGDLGAVGLDIILAAVIDDSVYEQAVRVIESAGGTI
ncbi:hypothetical protein GCM10008018_02520 [Paenibacillus marchantiophytorum]|uniref:Uncharacterized protein n=1 Tax=Paenibacillus marchantiophytorum TaxID=1619310 RepID=A0ABQ2BQV3_9BACL|nr:MULTISPECIES: hypothetical protein [Paenibacillus]UKS30370.1 hypothetical protein LOZ80_16095 [Paenibacillus sp. HWE-109]GGI43519.1 hypothetical protein GCM10008018_02520 [Paenibacillus marchantiophytorum]